MYTQHLHYSASKHSSVSPKLFHPPYLDPRGPESWSTSEILDIVKSLSSELASGHSAAVTSFTRSDLSKSQSHEEQNMVHCSLNPALISVAAGTMSWCDSDCCPSIPASCSITTPGSASCHPNPRSWYRTSPTPEAPRLSHKHYPYKQGCLKSHYRSHTCSLAFSGVRRSAANTVILSGHLQKWEHTRNVFICPRSWNCKHKHGSPSS